MTSLFDPCQLGSVRLKNRIVMSPMTRARAGAGRTPIELMRQYYCQRAGAGLIITEGTSISPQGVGYQNTPGIWCKAQLQGWQKITDTVHQKGAKIFLQLWHVGRISDPELLNGEIPVAPSAIACQGSVSLLTPERPYVVPRALQTDEIPGLIADYVQAARNAKEAGFDGVVVHSGNGYLIDQFLHDGSNHRTDHYGGAIPNRLRLLLEVVDACIGVWGAERVGVNISPGGTTHDMSDSNPTDLFKEVARQLSLRQLAFLFVREPAGPDSLLPELKQQFGGPLIANDSYTADSAQQVLSSGQADAVAFGRLFIANPDLPQRLASQSPLNQPDRSTFYSGGSKGYTDYASASELTNKNSLCHQ